MTTVKGACERGESEVLAYLPATLALFDPFCITFLPKGRPWGGHHPRRFVTVRPDCRLAVRTGN